MVVDIVLSILSFMKKYERVIDKDRILRHEIKNEFLVVKAKLLDSQDNEEVVNYGLISGYNNGNGLIVKNTFATPQGEMKFVYNDSGKWNFCKRKAGREKSNH